MRLTIELNHQARAPPLLCLLNPLGYISGGGGVYDPLNLEEIDSIILGENGGYTCRYYEERQKDLF
jgi:hypothetical protein